jgi:hypothetical protein
MTIILTTEENKVFKKNQEMLEKIHQKIMQNNYLKNFKNTAIEPSIVDSIATWKIYQINNLENFAHIPSENYTKVLIEDEIMDGARFIHPQLTQKKYVIDKINLFKQLLMPYPLELELFAKLTIDPNDVRPIMLYVYIKDTDYNIPIDFFSTNTDNLLSLIESNLVFHQYDEDIFLNTLNQVRETKKAIDEKKQLENSLNHVNQQSSHSNKMKI